MDALRRVGRSGLGAFAALWLALGPAAAAADQPADPGFSMIIASDSQITWWREGLDPDCSSARDWGEETVNQDSCVDTKGKETNRDQASAINRVMELGRWPAGSPINTPKGVILNGDLMATGHMWEWDLFEQYYGKDKLTYQPYIGLGNHDYSNHAKDCVYFATYHGDKSSCAKFALWHLGQALDSKIPNIVSRDWPAKIAVKNSGGFNLRFKVSYVHAGQTHNKSVGSYVSGEWRGIAVPWDARDVLVTFEAQSLLHWIDLGTRTLTDARTACWQVSGTLGLVSIDAATCPTAWPGGTQGSGAYSFDVAGQDAQGPFTYHFVQLHNKPSYAIDLPNAGTPYHPGPYVAGQSPSVRVTQSYDWLRRDLEQATREDKRIVLNMHDLEVSPTLSAGANANPLKLNDAKLLELIKGQNVVAMFGAHFHQEYGYLGNIEVARSDGSLRLIPAFRDGSAECQRFLLADFRRDYFNVGVVSSFGGKPAIEAQPTICDDRALKDSAKYEGIKKYSRNGAVKSLGTFPIHNRPPQISLFNLPVGPVVETRPIAPGLNATDPDGDRMSFMWAFGDGATTTNVQPTHSYADEGTYSARAVVDDGRGSQRVARFTVNVSNMPPGAQFERRFIDDTGKGRLVGKVIDAPADSHTLNIEWGDGATETLTLDAGKPSIDVEHNFGGSLPGAGIPNSYTVKVTITDNDQGSSTVSTILERNVPRLLLPQTFYIRQDNSATLSGHVSGANGQAENVTLAITWGDGATETAFVPAGTTQFILTHAYPPAGAQEYTVSVTAFRRGLSASETTRAVRLPIAPLTVRVDQDHISTREGQPFTLSGTILSNLAPQPLMLTIRWWEGDETVAIAPGQTTFNVSHVIADSRPPSHAHFIDYYVPLVLTASNGTSTTSQAWVKVANVAPTATLTAPASVGAGQTFDLKLTGPSDPSGADTAAGFKYSFDCGTGAGFGGASPASSATCTASTAGTLTVHGKIADQDLAETVYTATVQVR